LILVLMSILKGCSNMKMDEIKKLIKLVEGSEISELAIEEGSHKVEIKKHSCPTTVVSSPAAAQTASAAPVPVKNNEPAAPAAGDDHGGLTAVKSPMVGTFYSSPSPDAKSFVKVGDKVSKGQVICIVEAMKTFNEIESEVSGTVEKILADNAQSVDFGQPLILIKES